MEDTQLRQVLRDYVTESEPPIELTTTAMLTAARRQHRVRRAAAAVAGVAAIALTVAAVAATPGVLRNLVKPDDHPASRAGVVETCPATAITSDERQTAMTCYVLTTVAAMVPDARFEVVVDECRDAPPLYACPVGLGYAAEAYITDAAGSGRLWINIDPIDAPGTQSKLPPEACRRPDRPLCEDRSGPGGIPLQILYAPHLPSGAEYNHVVAFHAGTVVMASAGNFDPSGDRKPTRPHPILNIDQLITMVTAPQLNLFP
jgi:hypothetical protein